MKNCNKCNSDKYVEACCWCKLLYCEEHRNRKYHECYPNCKSVVELKDVVELKEDTSKEPIVDVEHKQHLLDEEVVKQCELLKKKLVVLKK